MSSFLLSNVMKAALALTNGTNLLSNDDELTLDSINNDLTFNSSNQTLFDDKPDSLFFPNGIPKVPKSSSIEHDRDMYIRSILTEGETTNSAQLPFQLVIPMMMEKTRNGNQTNTQREYYSHQELNDIPDEERKKRQALLDKYN